MLATIFREWTPAIWSALAAIIIFYLPGTIILRLHKFSTASSALFSPAVVAGLLGLGAIAYGSIGIKWCALSAVSLLLLAIVCSILVNRFITKTLPPPLLPKTKILPIFLATLLTLPYNLWSIIKGMGSANAPAQTWDAVFHYSAIRWIRDTGNGSTLHLSSVASSLTENQSYKGGFYPAGFHDFVSLLPGNPIVATNAFVLVTVCLVWPLSCGFLASLISKNNAQLSFFATLASVTFVSFPERLVSYGTLWPNAYSYTLIPLALAAVITLLLPADRFSVRGALLSLVTLSGVGIAHPSGIFALSVGLLPFLCSFALKIAKRQIILTKTQLYLCVTSVLIAACTVIKVWMSPLFQNNVASWKRESISGIKDAILEALFENQFSNMGIGNPNPNYLLAILVIAGFVYLLLTRNNWWLIAAWSIAVYLFANSVSLRLPLYNLVGPWYGDPPRLGGIIPLYSTIIVGYGLVGIHNVLLSTARHYKTLPKERPVSIAVVAALALGFFVGTHRFNASGSTLQIQKNYLYFEGGAKLNQLLSPKERNMIERTPIDSKSTILGDPRTGVTFYYALRGNPVIFRHLSGSWDSDDVYLLKNIKNYGSDKKLCRITKRNNIRYLYSDSKLYWPQNQATRQYDSLNNFAKSLPPSAALAHAGKATLYRLPPCDAK